LGGRRIIKKTREALAGGRKLRGRGNDGHGLPIAHRKRLVAEEKELMLPRGCPTRASRDGFETAMQEPGRVHRPASLTSRARPCALPRTSKPARATHPCIA